MKRKFLLNSLLLLMLMSTISCNNKNEKRNGIFHNESNVGYQLLVYSFNDSDGDGRGDIKGITQKLDYFVDLGVNVLWLSPINKAGSYHGYDVQDYYEIDKRLGTKEDFKELLEEAHKKDIKILMDMVVNHTSNSHPWFVDACRNPDSKYRNFYTFKENGVSYGTSTNSGAGWFSRSGMQYYSSFTGSMPDLNLSNKLVKKEVEKIFEYWIDFGVDGFRLDAIKHFFDAGEYARGTDIKKLTSDYFKSLTKKIKKNNPHIFFVGEWLDEGSYVSYLTSAPYLDSQFSFYSRKMLLDTGSGNKSAMNLASKLTTEYNACLELNKEFTYTPIIGNHDHDRIASSFGFFDHPIKLRLVTQMLLTLPGMPFIYSGDEFGMTGARYENDDIERRLPFLWGIGNEVNPDTYGKGKYRQSVLDNRISSLVAKEDRLSLYNLHKDLIAVRNSSNAYKGGKISIVGKDDNSNVMAYFIEGNGQKLLIAHCVTNRSATLNLKNITLGENLFSTYQLGENNKDFAIDAQGNYTYSRENTYSFENDILTLSPFSTVIFEVK